MLTNEVKKQIELLRNLCAGNLVLYKKSKKLWHYKEAHRCKDKAKSIYDNAMQHYYNADITQEIKMVV